MHACSYVRAYECMYMHVYMHVYVYGHGYVYVYVGVPVCTDVRLYACTRV